MGKRVLKVVIYPETSGKHLLVEPNDVKKIIEMDQYNELSISMCNIADINTVPVLSDAIKKAQKIDIVFWNPLPDSEIKKLLKYDLEKINGVSISSVNHNLKSEIIPPNQKKRAMNEIEETEKKWEDFWEKRKVKSH